MDSLIFGLLFMVLIRNSSKSFLFSTRFSTSLSNLSFLSFQGPSPREKFLKSISCDFSDILADFFGLQAADF
jgi:hypothetical protein